MADSVNFTSSEIYKQYGWTQPDRVVGGNDLGKDAFLKILVAQLSNQDPTEPMKDTEFIAQMAQFSALEQMQQLNTTFTITQAQSTIGKYVRAEFNVESDDGLSIESKNITGLVQGTFVKNGEAYLIVGEYDVPYSSVKEIYGGADLFSLQNSSAQLLMQGSTLIGKYVQGTYTEGEGEDAKDVPIVGMVESVFIKSNVIYAKVEGKDVALGTISNVSSTPIKLPVDDTETGTETGTESESDII